MSKWEYVIENRIIGAQYVVSGDDFLRRRGDRGWELTAVLEDRRTFSAPCWVYYFKREIPPIRI